MRKSHTKASNNKWRDRVIFRPLQPKQIVKYTQNVHMYMIKGHIRFDRIKRVSSFEKIKMKAIIVWHVLGVVVVVDVY